MARKSKSRIRAERNAVLSRQAERGEQRRNYSTGRLPKLTFKSLGKLTDAQLLQVASRIGEEYEAEQIGQALRDAEKYQALPNIRLSKQERLLAERPDITDAEIDAAPSKRRKTLRQQQRRRRAAKDKRKRIQQYNAALMEDYTIGEVRDMEMRGESPFDIIEGAGVHETASEYLLRTRANVLNDKDYIVSELRRSDKARNGVINQILTQAGIIGYKAGSPIKEWDPPHSNIFDVPWQHDWDVVTWKLEAFDNSVNNAFNALTKRQKVWLFTSTNFVSLVNESTHYNPQTHKWELNASDGMPAVHEQLRDWMENARNH